MSKEELLKPRYKVIARYPNSFFVVGTILTLNDHNHFESDEHLISAHKLSEYTHLFKKLEWWEERKEEDMAELQYVKWVEIGYMNRPNELAGKIEEVREIQKYFETWLCKIDSKINAIRAEYFSPATKEEYENQNEKHIR